MHKLIGFAHLWYFVIFLMSCHYLYLLTDRLLPESPQNYLLAGLAGFVAVTFIAHLIIKFAPRT